MQQLQQQECNRAAQARCQGGPARDSDARATETCAIVTALDSAVTSMDKKALSERDICTKFITPALRAAGWDEMSQIREEVSFTKGRIIVRGKLVSRGKAMPRQRLVSARPRFVPPARRRP